ncbi:GNAT family N-acetyltransferase [Paenibacillus chibensis]|uniref:GNAT family N-acetyltransferase n=1 Tax=Paenibacillus chibensis TaxID=59846 RepID=A0ABU6Q0R6_9BACL|nr:GNAT family N-acetyltransferase [Paenibacillus chibensis]
MNRFQDFLELDYAYYLTFTERIDTTWGALFCNEKQADYYDANHAHITEEVRDPQAVIDEVIRFYESRNITPRFYIYNLELQANLLNALEANQFRSEEMISPVQLWDGRLDMKPLRSGNTVERVDDRNVQEALQIECSIQEFGGKETVEKVFMEQWAHPSYSHYLLRHEGIPVSTACLFEQNRQARLESVATLEKFRGKGLVGELIRYIQHEADLRKVRQLWVFPINEIIEKVYQKYGFQTVDSLKSVHAFAGGQSIREIRGHE